MARIESDILARFERMRASRSSWDALWQDIAEHIRPMRAEFTGRTTEGARRDRRIYDNAPSEALESFGGGVYGLLTNPANKWFALRFSDPDLNEIEGARDWLDRTTNVLLDSFQPGSARFYAVVPQLYIDWAGFGTGLFYSEDIPGTNRIYDSVRPLGECYIAANPYEEIDTVYRLARMTAREMVERFGSRAPSHVRQAYDSSDTQSRFDVIHAVEPNTRFRPGALGLRGKAWRATYVDRQSGERLSVGGVDEFPYQVPRWSVAAGEVYGRPKDILADVKMLQEMNRTMIVAAQRAAEPPILAYKENRASPIRMYSGGITYGAVTADGRDLLRPFQSGARLEVTAEMIRERRSAVRDSLFFSLLQLVERPNMTATEVLERQEEKLRLMGPNLGRLQTDFLSPLIKRRFGILVRKGMIPQAPPDLTGERLEVDYVSPLAKAVRLSEANAVNRWLTALSPLIEARPEILDKIDADAVVDVLADGFAVPPRVVRGAQDVALVRQNRLALGLANPLEKAE